MTNSTKLILLLFLMVINKFNNEVSSTIRELSLFLFAEDSKRIHEKTNTLCISFRTDFAMSINKKRDFQQRLELIVFFRRRNTLFVFP